MLISDVRKPVFVVHGIGGVPMLPREFSTRTPSAWCAIAGRSGAHSGPNFVISILRS
jgi:hypothetical protein